MAESKIEKALERYSLTEQVIGTWIDGSPIYRKSKVYSWAGSRIYDNDFFNGINVRQIIQQRIQLMSGGSYGQTSYYWTNTDYARCWISMSNNPMQVCMDAYTSTGTQILITVDYTKN